MSVRSEIESKYGAAVIAAMDEMALLLAREADLYRAGAPADDGGKREIALNEIKSRLIELGGPVTAVAIRPAKPEDRKMLLSLIEDFHSIDDALRPIFGSRPDVLLDSESSEMFVSASEESGAEIVKALKDRYPGIHWAAVRELETLQIIPLLVNWPSAVRWTELMSAQEKDGAKLDMLPLG